MTTRRILIALGLGGALALTSLAAGAHEMFLKPTNFHVAPNTRTEIALFNGTFDKSENPISRDRMRTVEVIAGGQVTRPSASQWRDDKVTSYLDLTLGEAGTYAVGVSTAPKIIELSADAFEDYLRHDGVEDVLKARQVETAPRTAVRERYSKHVKTILQVGSTQTDDYSTPFGLPAEILLLQNPAAVKVGDTIGFRALLRGQPMSGQLAYASFGGFQGADAQSGRAVKLRTDVDGRGSFKVTRAGVWYITLINMQKATGEATYESNWATLTFEIR
ncbi:DUF4198 domain-containing protein [Phenylobacterium sp. LH3H17]|uniref:DUF4198 domain-containing protein n=1 Tax=Phenylobacterium sp. LH3H17 TaxID=2903901 RepID=UPI0020C9F090|nr:DUF4198 domain-containing protein [Phenylobacterium sp. LH3H17]UTP38223.1 DUF4198 domain-containing protein [Phenylobacterium sp. LH3H17]